MQLDSIRALSALTVLFGHTHQTFLIPTINQGAIFAGFFTQLSVMVFFVLSGFLIGKSICNNTDKNSLFNLSQYAKDRAIRLYPPLIVSLLLMTALAALSPIFFPSGTHKLISIPGVQFVRSEYIVLTKELLGALAFIGTPVANGPLWSLSIEAWYYVTAAALILLPSRKWMAIILFIATLLATRKNHLFFMLAPVWFAGFGLSFLHQKKPEMNNQLFSRLLVALSILVAIAIICVWHSDNLTKKVWSDPLNYFRLFSGLWFACFLALLMGGAVRFPTWLNGHAWYSYTLYVIHFPIMLFILGVSQKFIYDSIFNSTIISIITIVICILISKLIALYAEDKKLLNNTVSFARRMVSGK